VNLLKYLFSVFYLIITSYSFAKEYEELLTQNYIYKTNIKTVILEQKGRNFSYPVIRLASKESLVLSFDDVTESGGDYSFTIIHCTYDWKISDLSENEYIDGFYDSHINNYESSFNTLKSYNHYEAEFPNEDIKPLISGNYILLVFEDDDRENLVLSRRLSVYEDKTNIDGKIIRSSLVEKMNTSQELEFNITSNGIYDPLDRIKIVIGQGKRQDNLIYDIQPTFIEGNKLIYKEASKLIFEAGNEFNFFNCKNKKYVISGIESISYQAELYKYFIIPEKVNEYAVYSGQQDINGEFFITSDDGVNMQTDADYVWVNFTLYRSSPELTGDYYVFGGLSDWRISEDNKMIYNNKTSAYELQMLLKQGFYNYQYVWAETQNSDINISKARGSHYQTENNYIIYCYYNEQGTLYDKLIGFKILNSQKKI